MLVKVVEAIYVKNFIINLSLSINNNDQINTITKSVDLKKYLENKKNSGIFAPLRDINYFKNFKLNANTIEWENGADIAPERFLEI